MTSTTTEPGRWRAPVQCDGPGNRTRLPVLPVDERRQSEAGILVQAYSDGNAALDAAHTEISPACSALERAYWAADNAVNRFHHFVAGKAAFRASRDMRMVDDLHVDDGPEDRRRRPRWASDIVVWTAIALSALYDTVFLGNILSQILDLGGPEAILAYLPGVGIAIGLMVTGWLFAVAYARRRFRVERALTRKYFGLFGKRERNRNDLPWPMWGLAILFGLGFLGTLAVWARNRAYLSAINPLYWDLKAFEYPIAGLLMLLTLSSVALKVISYNPYADDDREARKAVQSAGRTVEDLRRDAVEALATHAAAWSALMKTLAGTKAQAERFVEAGRARVLELRAERLIPGKPLLDTLTPITVGLWPATGEDGQGTSLVEQLRLHTEVLDYAYDLATRHAPDQLEARLREVDARLGIQLTGEDTD